VIQFSVDDAIDDSDDEVMIQLMQLSIDGSDDAHCDGG
jgi:hypothetical protein